MARQEELQSASWLSFDIFDQGMTFICFILCVVKNRPIRKPLFGNWFESLGTPPPGGWALGGVHGALGRPAVVQWVDLPGERDPDNIAIYRGFPGGYIDGAPKSDPKGNASVRRGALFREESLF